MTGINHAAFQEMPNLFTEQIISGEQKIVRLRNDVVVRPIWKAADEAEFGHFYTADWKYMWNADGTSVTRSDLDMVTFVSSLNDI